MTEATVGVHAERSERRRLLARARRLRRRADDLTTAGRLEEALACLESVVQICPSDGHSFLRIGNLYWEADNFESSLTAIRRAVALNPMFRVPRERLAGVLIELGRFKEAIYSCEELLIYFPGSLLGREMLCLSYLQTGQPRLALRTVTELIQIDPTNPHHHFKRGMLLRNQGSIAPAINAFQRVQYVSAVGSTISCEAEEALFSLDEQQIDKILVLLKEDWLFELKFRQDAETIGERGFALSSKGMERLISRANEPVGHRSKPYNESTYLAARYYN